MTGTYRLADEVGGQIACGEATRRDEGRHIDYAIHTEDIIPTLRESHEGLAEGEGQSDHYLILYEFAVDVQREKLRRTPPPKATRTDEVTKEELQWELDSVGNKIQNQEMHEVNREWITLSMATENTITDEKGRAGQRLRHEIKKPIRKCKATYQADKIQRITERKLRRLARRAKELTKKPDDAKLWSNVLTSAIPLQRRFPQLIHAEWGDMKAYAVPGILIPNH